MRVMWVLGALVPGVSQAWSSTAVSSSDMARAVLSERAPSPHSLRG